MIHGSCFVVQRDETSGSLMIRNINRNETGMRILRKQKVVAFALVTLILLTFTGFLHGGQASENPSPGRTGSEPGTVRPGGSDVQSGFDPSIAETGVEEGHEAPPEQVHMTKGRDIFPDREIPLLPDAPVPAEMVKIPAGHFTMGQLPVDRNPVGLYPDLPAERIYLPAYLIDRYPHPYRKGSMPTVYVTWAEARAVCEKMGKRLCTEAEWEKACKGPEEKVYPYGNHYSKDKCYTESEPYPGGRVKKIGEYPECVSGYGVYEMSGNINEWTATVFNWGLTGNESALLKGADYGLSHLSTRCSARAHHHDLYETKNHDDGIRCCRSIGTARKGKGK